MNAKWTYPKTPNALAIVDGTIFLAIGTSVVALDHQGRERWHESFARPIDALRACGRGVAFAQADRAAPTQIVALDPSGQEAWRYERRWGLHFQGITGDAQGLVLYGQDFGPDVRDHWVGLDAATGAVAFDVPPPADAGPTTAGAWLLAPVADGNGGLLRTDRSGRAPEPLTTFAHIAYAATAELVLINTRNDAGPTEVVAIELASGRERWRAAGGNNLELGIGDGHAAWVEGTATAGAPVVHDLSTGKRVWRGDALPSVDELDGYRCKLGPSALVCYCGFSHVVRYSLAATAPMQAREWKNDDPDASRFFDGSFVETTRDGVTCWA